MMGYSHTQVWQLRIRRDILAVEVPREEQGVPAPHQAPQPAPPGLGRRVPSTSGCNTSRDPSRRAEGCWHCRRPLPTQSGKQRAGQLVC